MNYFPLERNRYFYGKLLTVRDFEIEQNYAVNKRCLDNRILHGAGVACGLGVTVDDDSTLIIGSGMALDYEGHEIVVENSMLRKLNMIDGQETLGAAKDGWLCLRYKEEDVEPVNATGGAQGSRQCNMVREGYALSVTAEQPDYVTLLNASGRENVNVIYQSDELTLVFCAPSCVCAGSEFTVSVLVVKNEQTPPVQFTLEGSNSFAETAEQCLFLKYNESSTEKRKVYFVDFTLRAQNMSDLKTALLPEGCELNIELGSHHYRNQISVNAPVQLVASREAQTEYYHAIDNLEKQITGALLPIYLAKLELVHSAGGIFISSVTSLPFEQRLKAANDGTAGVSSQKEMSVSTSVHSLEYWQKPEVSAAWNSQSSSINFDFGIPSPEQYDYSVSHGAVEIPLPGGNRVNARYYSEEVPYGLGPGAVDVRLTVEFWDEDDGVCLVTGSSEVFRKTKNLPRVEAAAILYPERGTMKVGVWLHDDVKGNALRVHYFACRPSMDSSAMVVQRKVSVSVSPEMARVERGEQLSFKASVVGTEDKDVRWSVKDTDGGMIDGNGIYTAPQMQGTYEIEVVAAADNTAKATAFIIVD